MFNVNVLLHIFVETVMQFFFQDNTELYNITLEINISKSFFLENDVAVCPA